MSKRISEISKFRQGRGTGRGKDYKPWIYIYELNSIGTAESVPDWKTGRMIQCLSQGEVWVFHYLRFNENIEDIREQFPLLPINETAEIAEEKGTKGALKNNIVMTLDFLVTRTDGTEFGISVKDSEKSYKKRDRELFEIQKEYWKRRGVKLYLVFKDKLNINVKLNIEDAVTAYSDDRVFPGDNFSLARHLVATRKIHVDMTEKINYENLIENLEETKIWKAEKSKLGL